MKNLVEKPISGQGLVRLFELLWTYTWGELNRLSTRKYSLKEREEYRIEDGVYLYVSCSDAFDWGCADSECISDEDITLLEEAFKDVKLAVGSEDDDRLDQYLDDIYLLFVSRKRGVRPQGAMFGYIPESLHDLFKAVGPERVVGFGNPYSIEQGIERFKETKRDLRGE